MIVLAGIGLFTVSWFLDSYTQHDEFLEVPSFEGFHFSELDGYISDKDLMYEITDSVYDPNQARGVILEQVPAAGQKVKPGRKIYLTMNSVTPPSIILPELRDYTVRQVVMKIETYGLKIDSLMYKPADCDNCVIGVLYEGKEIEAGTEIEKGKAITLVIGEGIGTEKVGIPKLYALGFNEARDKLNSLGLNLGFVDYDTSVVNGDDSLAAFVYQQSPTYDTVNVVRKGTAFDLKMTLDSNKLPVFELPMADSLIENVGEEGNEQ